MKQNWEINLIFGLILVALTVSAANFFIGQQKERIRRMRLEDLLKITVADVDKKIADTIEREAKGKKALQQELQKEKEWSATLEKQIKDKEAQIQLALTKIAEKDRINGETIEKLREAEKRNAKLELELRQMETELVLLKKENEALKQTP